LNHFSKLTFLRSTKDSGEDGGGRKEHGVCNQLKETSNDGPCSLLSCELGFYLKLKVEVGGECCLVPVKPMCI
jgi:hypothetical protein